MDKKQQHSKDPIVHLTKEQEIVLKQSEKDIEQGRVISQKDLDQQDLEWLNQKAPNKKY